MSIAGDSSAPPEGLEGAILEAARHAEIGVAVSAIEADLVRNLWVSDVAARILGRPREALIDRSVVEFLAPEEREKMALQRERRLRGEPVPPTFETTIVTEDGRRVPLQVSICYVELRGQRVSVAFFVDISARKAKERELAASEARFRSVIEGAPDGVAITRDGVILYVNAAGARMLGYDDPSELAGRSLDEFLDEQGAATMRERVARMLALGRSLGPHEYGARRRDGTSVRVEITSLPMEYEGAPAVIGFARDVTARAAMQAQLARADRLAALGTLAAGVAHEINNPLTFMSLGIEAVQRTLRDAPIDDLTRGRLGTLLDEVCKGAQRVASIVHDLRVFSHFDEEGIGPTDLRAVLASAERIAAHEIRPRARLVSRYAGELPRVVGNAGKLEQVFVNLLVNAAQALGEGNQDNEVTIEANVEVDGRVAVVVRDNGPGIAPEVLGRVFDPFFTTKPPGVGTGLGLSICHGIVTQLGGEISIDSAPGCGTSVFVRLVAAETTHASASPSASTEPARRRARILVLDDEPALVLTLRCVLEQEHHVTATTDAREAIAHLLADDGWDLVLCDLAMPGLSGADVYEQIAAARPCLASRFVFMTGGAFTPRLQAFLDRTSTPTLQKPFPLGAIDDMLARAMQP